MGTILRILILCFLVGLILSYLHLSPYGLAGDLLRTLREMADFVVGLLRWAGPFVRLGAVVVLPVALILLVLRLARR